MTRPTDLGLPDNITALLFDLDGVLTPTAKVHCAAWKRTFDEFLAEHHEDQTPFTQADYNAHVDGKPREDGVRDFLRSRGIEPDQDTIDTIAERKQKMIDAELEQHGMEAYPGSLEYLEAVRQNTNLKTALVTSSKNGPTMVGAAGLGPYLDRIVDGNVRIEQRLKGKPAPDTFIYAAKLLDTEPANAAVFEDAVSGACAGSEGRFGYVVGVDRVGHAEDLRRAGADVVVEDLDELLRRTNDSK